MSARLSASVVCCLVAIGVAGCASSIRNDLKDVGLGMSPEEVRSIIGSPAAQAEQSAFQAWRYEYGVLGTDCSNMPGVRFNRTCRHVCEHTTVWFNDMEVRSITSIRVDGMEGCGTGSTPIIWEHMPDYAKAPDG